MNELTFIAGVFTGIVLSAAVALSTAVIYLVNWFNKIEPASDARPDESAYNERKLKSILRHVS